MAYIAMEEVNMIWDEKAVEIVKDLYRSGVALTAIAEVVKRPEDEVAILLMDLVRNRVIHARKSGLFGQVGPTKRNKAMKLYRCPCGTTYGFSGDSADKKRVCPVCGSGSYSIVHWQPEGLSV